MPGAIRWARRKTGGTRRASGSHRALFRGASPESGEDQCLGSAVDADQAGGARGNNRLVTEITPYDVEKLLEPNRGGRARPHKAKPNNRARKLQGAKPTPVRANRVGEVLRKMFTYAQSWGWREDNPASASAAASRIRASGFCRRRRSGNWHRRWTRPRIAVRRISSGSAC